MAVSVESYKRSDPVYNLVAASVLMQFLTLLLYVAYRMHYRAYTFLLLAICGSFVFNCIEALSLYTKQIIEPLEGKYSYPFYTLMGKDEWDVYFYKNKIAAVALAAALVYSAISLLRRKKLSTPLSLKKV